ncbi:hypothetical protein NDI86_07080 [Halomicroarcula sp. S3CR25-11]|uniref:Uncharacterized protein n=1 Tax=Haloarcula onubensis TaxID=2950539 RepID=A0ABU2FNK8_9EURY|nr:hypothetical protein [Halomicroarcula sp. S3CR25-11]
MAHGTVSLAVRPLTACHHPRPSASGAFENGAPSRRETGRRRQPALEERVDVNG